MSAHASNYPRRSMNPLVLILLAVVIIGLILAFQQGGIQTDSSKVSGNAESAAIMTSVRYGNCLETRHYYSASRGNLLILCKMSAVNWGGIIIKATEFRYDQIWHIGTEVPVPIVACFTGTFSYWQNVVSRDGYVSTLSLPANLGNYLSMVACKVGKP